MRVTRGFVETGRTDARIGGAVRILPVFPLEGTVLFPCTKLALHVFEPRYRTMIRDVTRGEGLIVVSLESGVYRVNMACAALPIDAALKQRLLDEDSLMERQRQTMGHISKVVETLNWLRASKGSDNATLMN